MRRGSYEACLVYPSKKKKTTTTEDEHGLCEAARADLAKLEAGGIEYAVRESRDGTETFVLLRVSTERLAQMADVMDLPVLLDAAEVERRATEGDPSKQRRPFDVRHDARVTELKPYESIYEIGRAHV